MQKIIFLVIFLCTIWADGGEILNKVKLGVDRAVQRNGCRLHKVGSLVHNHHHGQDPCQDQNNEFISNNNNNNPQVNDLTLNTDYSDNFKSRQDQIGNRQLDTKEEEEEGEKTVELNRAKEDILKPTQKSTNSGMGPKGDQNETMPVSRRIIAVGGNCPEGYVADTDGNCREKY